jgi:glutamyl-tRNA reductase
MERTLFVTGVNHRTAALAIRERLAYADVEIAPALGRLRARLPIIAEAALVSTCNRVELLGLAHGGAPAPAEIAAFFAADRAVEQERFAPMLYHFAGRDAVRHLFRVGASLDSMVVGEPQILGQLKVAYADAVAADAAGLVLHRAFHRAFAVGKQVRKATLIGHGAVSVSSAAVSLAGKIFDTLRDKTVMILGAGRVAELAARNLQRAGLHSLLVASRTFDHAVALARELGGTAVPYDEFKSYLKLADIVIASLAVSQPDRPILAPAEVEAIVRDRRYRPMFLIDLGVPRNFDPRINALANVYLYDIDDLGAVAARSLEDRAREAEKAAELVELEADAFMRWLGGLELVPAIKQIRSSIEHLREDELARNQGWLSGLPTAERARVEAMTRGLVNKLLHRVLSALRDESAGASSQLHAAEVARRLLCPEAGDESAFTEIALPDELNDEEEF